MTRTTSHYQRGFADFRKMLLFAGGAFVLFGTVIALSSVPKKDAATPTAQKPAATPSVAPSVNPTPTEQKPKTAVVKLPADFRRFTSKQYNFSVAYPESWGSPITQPSPSGATLYATTKDVNYPLSTAALVGKFAVLSYYKDTFKLAVRPGNPVVQPFEKDGKTVWQVTSVAENEPTYRVGNAYKVDSRTNPSGLTIYDFTWVNPQGQREGRWVFKAKDTYIQMTLPPITSASGAASPSGNELSFYTAFVNQVIDSVTIPQ